MMDSGAADHVCHPDRHFLSYAIRQDTPKHGRRFVTATGQIIDNMGERHARVKTGEGCNCNITFQVAKVDTPVLSTRKLSESCKRDWDLFDD